MYGVLFLARDDEVQAQFWFEKAFHKSDAVTLEAVLGPAVRLLKKSGATLPGSVGVALVASLVPQMLVVMGREAVVDPGFVLRSLVVAALTLPIVWAWLPGPQKEA